MLTSCTFRSVGLPYRPPSGRNLARISTSSLPTTRLSVFLEEIAVAQTPPRLKALLQVLDQQGAQPVSPADRTGLHPLVVPLAVQPGANGEAGSILGLLRWPDAIAYKAMPLPLVSVARGSSSLKLVARNVDEQLHRLLVEEDLAAGPRPLAEAAGAEGQQLYAAGQAEQAGCTGAAKLPMYLIRKVGMFPDVCEQLAHNHLKRNDQVSALVASDWYMRNNFFPGWARPYEFAAELLMGLKRAEEARDMARAALRLPWWTLQGAFADVQAVAQIPGTPQELQHALSEEAQAQAQAQVNKVAFRESRTTQQLALQDATNLLDLACIGAIPGGYAAARPQLASSYRQAGLSDVANFIEAAA